MNAMSTKKYFKIDHGRFIHSKKKLEITQVSVNIEWINHSKNWKTATYGQNMACHLFLYGQWPKKGFAFLNDVKKIKIRIAFCNM